MLRGKKRGVEALWRDLFSHNSEWWDHRPEKIRLTFPDFKHKRTGESLWLVDARNPPWVQIELAALPPGALQPNVFAWVQRLKKFVKAGQYVKTIEVFDQMQQENICPDKWSFLPVLNACAGLGALEEGKRIHTQIIQVGYESDIYVCNCLVDMYAKCDSIEDAWIVFNKMKERNVVTWSAIIGGYLKSGQGLKAMALYRKMIGEGVEPNAVTFVGVLNACASVGALDQGRCVHKQIIQRGCESNIYVANCLVDMYAKCGCIEGAWVVFNKMQERNAVTWNAMIGGYLKSGQGLKAIELFEKMHQEGVEPDVVTFVEMLNACASVTALEKGRCVHEQIIRRGCESDVYVGSSLVDMYSKCGSIENAWSAFKMILQHNVVSWNVMIASYVKFGHGLKAIKLFQQMQQEGVEPNAVTFVGVLNACASVSALEEGRRVHEQINQTGCESDVYLGSSLVDMYAKCGSTEDAWTVFSKMPEHNVVTWSAMILGYVKSGQGLKAMELFWEMQRGGVEPNVITFVGMLNACASVAAFEEGRCVHEQIIRRGCESDVFVGSSLIDMYAKCGSIGDAQSVFNKMSKQDVVAWNTMLGGYAMHGHAKNAVELFGCMRKEGLQIDGITFTCLLSACSHGGLVKEGLRYFKSMVPCFDILPTMEHYACMVDLLGRAGQLGEAEELTKRLPFENDICVWMSLLGACIIHGNVEMSERTAKRCLKLDPENLSGHVLFLNMYAITGKCSETVDKERSGRGISKEHGRAWIELNNVVHLFLGQEEEHCQLPEIIKELEHLSVQMKEAGYLPDTRFLLQEEKKRSHKYSRTEKLSLDHELMSTLPSTQLPIKKNLWVSPGCHGATKFIRNTVVSVQDAKSFHHFEGGSCSCKHYLCCE